MGQPDVEPGGGVDEVPLLFRMAAHRVAEFVEQRQLPRLKPPRGGLFVELEQQSLEEPRGSRM